MKIMNRAATGLGCAAAIVSVQGAAAQDRSEDQARIHALEQRVAELEDRGPALTFGNETTAQLEIYGYLKADAIHDFDTDLGTTTFGLANVDPGDLSGSNFRAQAYQTRLGLRFSTPTEYGPLETQIETDFYGDGGGELRLRHATATLADIRIGRYWTTFMPLASYPITLDFQGVAGIPFARETQLRYTHRFGNDYVAEVALEDPPFESDKPVLIGALAYDTDPLLLRLSALVGQVETPNNDVDAYGINVSTTATVWSGGTVKAAYTKGEAIASYMVFLGDDYRTEGTADVAIDTEAAYIGLDQELGEKLILGAVYGYRKNGSAPGGIVGTRKLETIHLNARYGLTDNLTLGVEYFNGERVTFDAGEARVERVQASVQVDF